MKNVFFVVVVVFISASSLAAPLLPSLAAPVYSNNNQIFIRISDYKLEQHGNLWFILDALALSAEQDYCNYGLLPLIYEARRDQLKNLVKWKIPFGWVIILKPPNTNDTILGYVWQLCSTRPTRSVCNPCGGYISWPRIVWPVTIDSIQAILESSCISYNYVDLNVVANQLVPIVEEQPPIEMEVTSVCESLPGYHGAVISIVASGFPNLYYQWYKDGIPFGRNTMFNSWTYVSTCELGTSQYFCKATNCFGTAISSVTTVTVTE